MKLLICMCIMSIQSSDLIWNDFYDSDVLICYTNEEIRKLINYDNYLVLSSHFQNLNEKAMYFTNADSVKLLVSGSKFYSFCLNTFGGCVLYLHSGSYILHKITSFNMTCNAASSHIYSSINSNNKTFILSSTMDVGKSDFGALEMGGGDIRCTDNNITNMISNNAAANLYFNSEEMTTFSNCINNTAYPSGILFLTGVPFCTMKMYNIVSNSIIGNDIPNGIVNSGYNGLILSECAIVNNVSPYLFVTIYNGYITVNSTYISGNNYQNFKTEQYSGRSIIVETTNSFDVNFCEYSITSYLTFVIKAKQASPKICSCECRVDRKFAIFLGLVIR